MTVYILYSEKLQKYYVGSTADVNERLQRHNRGDTTFTRAGIPWKLIWALEVENRSVAVQLEKKIKGRGIKRFLEEKGHASLIE